MNIQIPNHKEIKKAFSQGEDAVVILFENLGAQLIELALQLQKQSDIIQALEAKLSKNSKNSSKPPSSDGYSKQNRTESLRQKSDKSNGGQLGHKGETLKAVENPDEIENHDKACCENCQTSLEDTEISGVEERQVFDIPAMKIVVTAHQASIKICPECQTENKGDFPENVDHPVQYGNGVKTVASYFNNEHFIPVARTAQIFKDLYGQAPSEATIINANQQLNQHIEPARAAVKQQLHQARVLHSDETGLRVEGQLYWLHSASTDKLTDYEIHKKRGKDGMDAAGILEGYQGKLVHDHWKTYFAYEDCEHIACNAHHLRELIYIEKQYQQPWASELARLLVEIKNTVDKTKVEKNYLSKEQHRLFEKRYDALITTGLEKNPFVETKSIEGKPKKRGKPKQTPAYNLLLRLRDFKAETLAFMYDFSVPFDNNLAERDIRMVKVKQKVSGGFRTQEGAKQFASIRSYISTARKNSVSIFEAIKEAFSDNPFIPAPQG
jgi:transposase